MIDPKNGEHRGGAEGEPLQLALAFIESQADLQEMRQQVLADTLARIRHAAPVAVSNKNLLFRIAALTFRQRIAAAIVLTLGGLSLWIVLSVFGGFTSVTYAQVAEQIRALRTVSWNETVSGGASPMRLTIKTYCMEPSHVRMEIGQGMAVTIIDQASGKSLVLNGLTRTAELMQIQTTGVPAPMQDTAAYFRNLAEQKGEPIEDRVIGDITARGFRTTSFGFPTSLWVDPKTKRPLMVESTVTMGGQEMKLRMTDFVFDAPLEQSLFSLQPPPGYKVSQIHPMVIVIDLEQNVTTLLRYYSAENGGSFPPSLNDILQLTKMVSPHMSNGQFDDDGQKIISALGAMTGSMMFLSQGTDYGYTPQGVKLGDAGKRVFWYLNKDTKTYRAIYGDLHAADIAAAELPIKK